MQHYEYKNIPLETNLQLPSSKSITLVSVLISYIHLILSFKLDVFQEISPQKFCTHSSGILDHMTNHRSFLDFTTQTQG